MFHVGLDIHSKYVSICALGETGQVALRCRVRGFQEVLRVLRGLPGRFEACHEAGGGYGHSHSGRTPGSDMAQRDAAGVNGGDRITSRGAPRPRVMPNGRLGSPVITLLFWP